jgi:two-component system phosphate regulon sensor histidine kinase PhoR
MFSQKNFSPRQLSVICALIISVPVALLLLILVPNKWLSLISWAVIFSGSYFLISYTIDSFVYRQIKLIYKIISQTKASKREEFYYKNLLPQKRIDEVTVDVEKWAQQKKNEIEMLQQNEVFRKEFLQNLSHELKTPIFSIQGYIDTLLNGALHNNEVNQKFLQSAERNIERLVNLVDDLDEISKLESGELKLNCQNFIIQDLVKDVFDSLLIKIKEREISCIIKKGSEQSLTVYADKEKIRQVIINLVDNAIKYGKQNGTIEAGFYKMENKTVMIEITDDGSGISEEHRLRIFERFYRTDHARSRKVGGSGLGLAICKHIIEAHEQKIEVRSAIDVGTTFHFFLATGK